VNSHYDHPEDLTGTVFDPTDDTFGPIMEAFQSGDFAKAQRLTCELLDDYSELDLFELTETYLAVRNALSRLGSDLCLRTGYASPEGFIDGMTRLVRESS
jgi:hypothetical protein